MLVKEPVVDTGALHIIINTILRLVSVRLNNVPVSPLFNTSQRSLCHAVLHVSFRVLHSTVRPLQMHVVGTDDALAFMHLENANHFVSRDLFA